RAGRWGRQRAAARSGSPPTKRRDDSSRSMPTSMRDLALALLMLGAAVTPAAALERLSAVVHVHSTLSTGNLTLDQLAATAQDNGVGALLLSENYLLRIQYGLPPFRALTHAVYEEASVLGRADEYFARVAETRRRFPGLVIVPGVEVIPHYFWSG